MNKHIQIQNLTFKYDNKTEQLTITKKASDLTIINEYFNKP